MMHPKTFRLTGAILLSCVLAFSGCLGGAGKTPATRYYILNSMYSAENKAQPVAVLKDTSVGVGPIRLSQVLDRPQIVMQTSDNEIRISDFERWAAPLNENMAGVIVDNLTVLLPGGEILKFPWQITIPITYQVVIDIMRFDGMPGGEAVLRARWGILGENGKKVLLNKVSVLNEAIQGNTIAEMVSAQSRLAAKFSRQIAEEIKRLEEQGGEQ
jgi:uncharacterized lipoprotein YmbA